MKKIDVKMKSNSVNYSLKFLLVIMFMHLFSCNTKSQKTNVISTNVDSLGIVNNPEWFYFGYTQERLIEKNGKQKDGHKIGLWNYTVDKKYKRSIVWKYYNVENLEFSIPAKWIIKDSNKTFFSVEVPNYQDSYFAILKQQTNYSPLEYLGYSYDLSLEDENEKLVFVSAKAIETVDSREKKVIYRFKFSYEGEFWYALGLVFLHGDYLYDVVLKIQEKESVIPYWEREIFTDIINCFKIDDEFIIPSMEKLVDISEITFEE